ncbi:MAG TPA: VCBS repeat-containing protein, partial [Bryobacteraceae bacterium]|nr:VCBS repeat-containing protein [Bryobacteraceae bacterium]
MISNDLAGVLHGISIVDWDGDRRDEILTASFEGISLFQLGGKWRRTRLAQGSPDAWPKCGSSEVAVGRIGKRRFLCAIEPWHGNQVVVYVERRGQWERQV